MTRTSKPRLGDIVHVFIASPECDDTEGFGEVAEIKGRKVRLKDVTASLNPSKAGMQVWIDRAFCKVLRRPE